jgi:hypothetical protein
MSDETGGGQGGSGQAKGEATASWAPDACTLPTAERPLRAADFDELFAGTVLGMERPDPTRLRLHLRHDPEAAGRAAGLAAAETGCCSFFTFTLTVTGSALTLDVAVPVAHVAVLDALRDRVAATAGAATARAANAGSAGVA